MSTTVVGVIEHLGTVESSQYGNKQTIVIATALTERKPNYLSMTLVQDIAIKDANELGVGASVVATYDVVGRKYEKKDGSGTGYFTFLECWRVQPETTVNTANAADTAIPF